MSLAQELSLSFEFLNVSLKPPELKKCVQLCETYKIQPEDFVDQWLAYTASHLNGAPPTIDALEKMERKDLQKTDFTKKPEKIDEDSEVITPKKGAPEETYVSRTPGSPQCVLDTPTQIYVDRKDSRSVQCEYVAVNQDNKPLENGNFIGKHRENIHIMFEHSEAVKTCRYMYEKFQDRREAINKATWWVVGQILKENNLELTYEKITDYSGEMVICGRISSDSPGRLNTHSVTLEGTLELSRGQTMKLAIDNVENFALFTGQIVVIKGSNMKNRFVVREIYNGAVLPRPQPPPSLCESLQLVVASGPFTMPDNLLYEPLGDLLKYVEEFKPNVLVLLGPILETSHNLLAAMTESFESFFDTAVEGILEALRPLGTQLVLIPSARDVHNHPIFPSLPYKTRKVHENLILAPNPCILDIQGVKMAASSVDVLFHIGKNETFRGNTMKKMDRMSRLASHILRQGCFYPLIPADPDIRVDFQLLENIGVLEQAPDLMILPSNFRHFVKKVDGVVIVNPERLSKGSTAGTFARIEVQPGEGPLSERINCQILKI